MGTKEREEITRVDGKECIEIAAFKEGDANTVDGGARAARAHRPVEQEAAGRRRSSPILFDQSHFIEQSIKEVRELGADRRPLAIIVLFLFLRELRSTAHHRDVDPARRWWRRSC